MCAVTRTPARRPSSRSCSRTSHSPAGDRARGATRSTPDHPARRGRAPRERSRANSGQKSSLTGTRCSSRAPFKRTTIVPDRAIQITEAHPQHAVAAMLIRPVADPLPCPPQQRQQRPVTRDRAAPSNRTATSGSTRRRQHAAARARAAHRDAHGAARPGQASRARPPSPPTPPGTGLAPAPPHALARSRSRPPGTRRTTPTRSADD